MPRVWTQGPSSEVPSLPPYSSQDKSHLSCPSPPRGSLLLHFGKTRPCLHVGNKAHQITQRGVSFQFVVPPTKATHVPKNVAPPIDDLAADFGYSVFIVEAQNAFGNVHGVPESVIEAMQDRWEPIVRKPLPLWRILRTRWQNFVNRYFRWGK